MINSLAVRITASLLIAIIVLTGCTTTNPDVSAGPNLDVVTETTAVSDLDVSGGSSSASSDTPLKETNESGRGQEAAELLGGFILFPFALAMLAALSSVGLY